MPDTPTRSAYLQGMSAESRTVMGARIEREWGPPEDRILDTDKLNLGKLYDLARTGEWLTHLEGIAKARETPARSQMVASTHRGSRRVSFSTPPASAASDRSASPGTPPRAAPSSRLVNRSLAQTVAGPVVASARPWAVARPNVISPEASVDRLEQEILPVAVQAERDL
jgi:hypothetical protein